MAKIVIRKEGQGQQNAARDNNSQSALYKFKREKPTIIIIMLYRVRQLYISIHVFFFFHRIGTGIEINVINKIRKKKLIYFLFISVPS